MTFKIDSSKIEERLIYKDVYNVEGYNVPSYAAPRKADLIVDKSI
jgi:Ni,Fe-hydrogenase III small subunit